MFTWKGDRLDQMSRSHLLRNVGSYTVLFMAFGAMTFFGVCDPGSSVRSGAPSGTAATIGGDRITASEFKRFYSSTLDRFRSSQPDFDAQKFQLSRRVMDYMVGERAAFVRARELGLKASPAEVENLVVSEAERFKGEDGKFSAEQFNRWLKYNGHTEASFIEEQQRTLTMQKLEQVVDNAIFVSTKAAEGDFVASETKLDIDYLKIEPKDVQVNISDADVTTFLDEKGKEEVKKYYDANQREFNTPEEVKARHILIAFDGARNASADAAKRTKDQARKKAEEVLKEARAPNADFASIARKETDEASGKKSGGDLGWFQREVMVKEFSDAAFVMTNGQISDLVESPFGFHIIKVEDKRAAKSTSLEDATVSVARKLLEKDKKPELVKARADKVLTDVKASPTTKAHGEWKSTGEFAAIARSIPGLGADASLRSAALSLTQANQVYSEAIQVGQNYFVIKLKSRKSPDMSKFDDDRKEQIKQSDKYTIARALVAQERANAKTQLEEKDQIWSNQEFAGWDEKGNTEQ